MTNRTNPVINYEALRRISANPLIQRLALSLQSSRGGPWLVGGAIRDILSGRRPSGFDFLASSDVFETASSLATELNKPLKFLDTDFVQVVR